MSAPEVLVIDDDPAFVESLRAFLHSEGLAAEYAASWDEGVERFRVGLHELVIADFNLPGSAHGLQLLATVKPLRTSSRLVLISGALLPRAEDLIRDLSLVDAYYVKSGKLHEQLAAEVDKAAQRSGQASQWPAIAIAHRTAATLDANEVARIDDLLKLQLSGS